MDINHIEYKKPFYPINEALNEYLNRYSRLDKLPLHYDELLNYREIIPLYIDEEPALWNAVMYDPSEIDSINERLVLLYQILNSHGHSLDHLRVGSIDFCSYGNSKPFRIKIINEINDNHDYFYIKKTDASRIYGLELEHLLSPNKINYMTDGDTILEEHIIGIPGDVFIQNHGSKIEAVRLSKEFVKFNERCFARLLGDMRSYNFVIVITQDFDKVQYRIRAIDFDQQSFEGRKSIYLPQFYKDKLYFVETAQSSMSVKTSEQYVNEERALLRKRILLARNQVIDLIKVMKLDSISTKEHINLLKSELNTFYSCDAFTECSSMGEIVELNLEMRLEFKL
ncbi:MAG: hypothetical protein HRT57_15635 [Crocinitomicaceae bacterium]|nr:hypothetical protein [Crocinitomicaceae bacterium]